MPSSVFLDGLGSLTLGNVQGGMANTSIDVTARTKLVTAAGDTFTVSLGGTGGLSKTGPGTVTLSGNNTYTGGTTVNSGTLVITSSTALSAIGVLTVGGGQSVVSMVPSVVVAANTIHLSSLSIVTDTGNSAASPLANSSEPASLGRGRRRNASGIPLPSSQCPKSRRATQSLPPPFRKAPRSNNRRYRRIRYRRRPAMKRARLAGSDIARCLFDVCRSRIGRGQASQPGQSSIWNQPCWRPSQPIVPLLPTSPKAVQGAIPAMPARAVDVAMLSWVSASSVEGDVSLDEIETGSLRDL